MDDEGGESLDEDSLDVVWVLQAAASGILVLTCMYQLWRPYRRRTGPRHQVTPGLRLTSASAVYLIAQGFLIAGLLEGLYENLTTIRDASVDDSWSAAEVSAELTAIMASLASIVMLVLGRYKPARMIFNGTMSILSGTLGTLQQWTPLTVCATAAYLTSFAADGCLRDDFDLHQMPKSSLFEYLFFSYVGGYISDGQTRPLTAADLPSMPEQINPDKIHERLDQGDGAGTTALPQFGMMLWRLSSSNLVLSFMWEMVNLICRFAQPWVLQALLSTRRFSFVVALLAIGIIHALVTSHSLYQLKTAGAKLKAGLGSRVFDKASRSTRTKHAEMSAVNLLEVDISRIQEFVAHIHVVWSTPLQVIMSLVSLGKLLGWQSGLASAGSVLLLIPIYWLCNYLMQKFQIRAMMRRDARMSLTSEALANADMVKLWGQEQLIEDRLDNLRSLELAVQQRITWVSAITTVLVRSASTFISVAAFLVAMSVYTRLTSEQIFPALLLCALLIMPLTFLPFTLSSWAMCIVSYRRLRVFCAPGQEPVETYGGLPSNSIDLQIQRVAVDSAAISWPDEPETTFLQDISLHILDGELAILRGPSSGGKTTILKLLIGSLPSDEGTIKLAGTIAYVSQEHWLTTASVRDNILFGNEFDELFYNRVVEACALTVDFSLMPDGDATVVGNHSSGLSGGQKSRIALARAVYSRADIYLLDDPLASLDIGVQAFIVEAVLGPRGILKDYTRIIATNSRQLTAMGDKIFEVSQGTVLDVSETEASADVQASSDSTETFADEILAVKEEAEDDPLLQALELDDTAASINEAAALVAEVTDEGQLFDIGAGKDFELADGSTSTRLVPSTAYRRWFGIAGPWSWSVMVILTALSYVAGIYGKYVLRDVGETFSQGQATYGLFLYALASIVQGLFACFSMIAGWYLCLKPTSQIIHRYLVSGVLRSPMQVLHAVPTGEIMNRFANDLARQDHPLFLTIFMILNSILLIASSLFVFIVAIPLSVIPIIPLIGVCWWLFRRVLPVLVDSKRLETSSRSPLITNMQETMDGTDIIRIFGQYSYFRSQNYVNLTRALGAFMTVVAVDLWLVLRLSLVSTLLQGMAATALLISDTDSGTMGLVMSYILQVALSLSGIVLQRTQMEAEMVSVQRIFAIADIEPEPRVLDRSRSSPVPAAWPHEGRVIFKAFTAAYRAGGVPVLNKVDLVFSPGQSTAIVGRTGAGKSSLAMSLLRALHPVSGSIEVDGLDIAQVDLGDIRSRVAIIPQNCRAFAGTIRSNLDPHGEHDESDLLRVIRDSMLEGYFESAAFALDTPVAKGGSNLSSGQLQLLGVARSLLLNTNVVVLDEVTTTIDPAIERQIHQVLAAQFRTKTRIIITHRLESAIENDRIVVLDRGEVVEVGSAHELYEKGGLFRDMIVAAGLEDRVS